MQPHSSARQRAESLAAAGRADEASAMLEDMAAAGDAEAMFTLGVWQATGQHVGRDLAGARAWFGRAEAAGLPQAAVIHTNFVAAGVGGPADWGAALAALARRAERDQASRRQLELIEAMSLSPAGDPLETPRGEAISRSPFVQLFRNLFTSGECGLVAEIAAPLMRPAMVVDPASGSQVRNPIRTSDGAIFTWALENPFIHALNRRIAAASGTQFAQGEPLQVLRYRPGQQYRTHVDALAGLDNQRVLTMLVYLNDQFEGGATRFVASGTDLRGGCGDAILFRNVDDDGRPDPRSAHAGLPVTAGTKLIASRWIRQRTFVAEAPAAPVRPGSH